MEKHGGNESCFAFSPELLPPQRLQTLFIRAVSKKKARGYFDINVAPRVVVCVMKGRYQVRESGPLTTLLARAVTPNSLDSLIADCTGVQSRPSDAPNKVQ